MPFGLGKSYLSHELPSDNFFSQYPVLQTYATFREENNYGINPSSLYQYAFETPNTALGDLTTRDSMVMLFVLIMMLKQVKAVVCPIFCSWGSKIGRSTHGAGWEVENEEKVVKFGEYVFRFMFHSIASIAGLYFSWDKPWWDQEKGGTIHFYLDYPNHIIGIGSIWYYLMQGAYNVDAMASLIQLSFVVKVQNPFGSQTKTIQSPIVIGWSPTCRGDFNEMFVHHVLTNLLLMGSSAIRLSRGGTMVFLIHDISDVPVDMSKLANFMKWKVTTIACFVTMMIVWAITRLGLLPFVFCRSMLYESHYAVPGIDVRYYYMIRPVFYGITFGIVGLHIFWFFLFLKIGYFLVFKKELHDLSEHKGGEKQHTNGKKTN